MKRNAILCGLLVAACGGGTKQQQIPTELGMTTHATSNSGAPPMVAAKPADPNLPFRKQFVNPGGMWMPMQMKLPQHIETFQKMGVKLSAEQLSDPLSEPLAAIVSLG